MNPLSEAKDGEGEIARWIGGAGFEFATVPEALVAPLG